jgi:holo-[acyl-carrier protein] synthase
MASLAGAMFRENHRQMNVVNIGTDIVECVRIAGMIERHGEHFLSRIFTPTEIRYCQSHKQQVERFAGRFAAKEAILKTLGTGWRNGLSWLEMEIINQKTGRPVVGLSGAARAQAERIGIRSIQISISHCRTHATAFAMGIDEGELAEVSIDAGE